MNPEVTRVPDAPLITAVGLKKRFGTVDAVDGLDLSISRGELFGFLGPNGAGKTTTINLLTGLARPDAGALEIGGIDCTRNPKAAQHLMGIVPDESNLYPELTGFENLLFCGAMYGMKRADRSDRARQLIEQFGLAAASDRKFAGYSKGMKRKLTIAAGIMHSPSILFLDEPTSGIDIASARQIRRLISELNSSGTTIFLTTHYIEEAERLCQRIAFIVSGRVVKVDTIGQLMEQVRSRHEIQCSFFPGSQPPLSVFTEIFPDMETRCLPDGSIRISSPDPVRVGPIVRFFEEAGSEVLEARRMMPSLEEVFLAVTGIEAARMKQEREKPAQGGGA